VPEHRQTFRRRRRPLRGGRRRGRGVHRRRGSLVWFVC
jgi:hypothetical protein